MLTVRTIAFDDFLACNEVVTSLTLLIAECKGLLVTTLEGTCLRSTGKNPDGSSMVDVMSRGLQQYFSQIIPSNEMLDYLQ